MNKATELSLRVPWGHVAAKAWGSPTNFPVLCVHGLLDNAGAFDRLITQLPKEYYYVSIDLPGHGLSSKFPSGIPLEFFNYLLTIRYIVEELKWKSFYYIGHSLGGQLGAFYCAIYPNQVQKLILIEGVAPKPIPNKSLISQIRKLQDASIKTQTEANFLLYNRDEVLHSLKYKRSCCLNNDAAEALFKRSVSEVNGLFKYNRDIRLKDEVRPFFDYNRTAIILSKLDTNILLFMTTSSTEILSSETVEFIKNIATSIKNINVIYVNGNHDVHNNNPERISTDISKFFNGTNILSKL